MFGDRQTNRRSLLSSLPVGVASGMEGADVSIVSATSSNSNVPSVERLRTHAGKERGYKSTERGAKLVWIDVDGDSRTSPVTGPSMSSTSRHCLTNSLLEINGGKQTPLEATHNLFGLTAVAPVVPTAGTPTAGKTGHVSARRTG